MGFAHLKLLPETIWVALLAGSRAVRTVQVLHRIFNGPADFDVKNIKLPWKSSRPIQLMMTCPCRSSLDTTVLSRKSRIIKCNNLIG
jgi:hypothetical protein